MNKPVMDAEELGKIACRSDWRRLMGTDEHADDYCASILTTYRASATAVRDAVCPPDTHLVVPKAELTGLLDATENVIDEDDWEGAFNGKLNQAINQLHEAMMLMRAALDQEPAND